MGGGGGGGGGGAPSGGGGAPGGGGGELRERARIFSKRVLNFSHQRLLRRVGRRRRLGHHERLFLAYTNWRRRRARLARRRWRRSSACSWRRR